MRKTLHRVTVAGLLAAPLLVAAGLPASGSATTPNPAGSSSTSAQTRIAGLEKKPWGHWAAAPVAVKAASVHAASASSTISDPVGDEINENGQPVNQPKADLISASARDTGTTITFSATTAVLSNPLTDPGWASIVSGSNIEGSSTGPTWMLFSGNNPSPTNGPIAFVSLANLAGSLQPQVEAFTSGTSGSGYLYSNNSCNAVGRFTPSGPNAGYSVSFPSACLGEIGRFYWGVSMTYDPASDTDGSLSVGDQAPNSPPLPEVDVFPATQGYWLAARDGGVFAHGSAAFDGSAGGQPLNSSIVAAAATPDGRGYFLAAADGGVFTYGDAHFYGSVASRRLTSPVAAVAVTPDGGGYLLAGANGSVFSFGDAPTLGSEAGFALTSPIVAAALTPDNSGYWLFSADGGAFNFGDAALYGTADAHPLNRPIVAAAVDAQTGGYWLVAADGGVFSFNAPFYGSLGGKHLNAPIVGITSTQAGTGYRLVAADGGIFDFGSASFAGSQASQHLNAPIIAAASLEG